MQVPNARVGTLRMNALNAPALKAFRHDHWYVTMQISCDNYATAADGKISG
jgi:hypothetical protein